MNDWAKPIRVLDGAKEPLTREQMERTGLFPKGAIDTLFPPKTPDPFKARVAKLLRDLERVDNAGPSDGCDGFYPGCPTCGAESVRTAPRGEITDTTAHEPDCALAALLREAEA